MKVHLTYELVATLIKRCFSVCFEKKTEQYDNVDKEPNYNVISMSHDVFVRGLRVWRHWKLYQALSPY